MSGSPNNEDEEIDEEENMEDAEEIDFQNIEEDLDDSSGKKPDSFISILADFFANVNYKLIIILFLSYVFIMSDLFIDKILSKVSNAVQNRDQLSPKGTLICGLLLVLLYMTADLLIKSKII